MTFESVELEYSVGCELHLITSINNFAGVEDYKR
jgi:hypothetical protein